MTDLGKPSSRDKQESVQLVRVASSAELANHPLDTPHKDGSLVNSAMRHKKGERHIFERYLNNFESSKFGSSEPSSNRKVKHRKRSVANRYEKNKSGQVSA